MNRIFKLYKRILAFIMLLAIFSSPVSLHAGTAGSKEAKKSISNEESQLEVLPHEILVYLVSFTGPKACKTLRLTSSILAEAVTDPHLPLQIKLSGKRKLAGFGSKDVSVYAKQTAIKAFRIPKLEISDPVLTDAELKNILKSNPKLTELTLNRCAQITDQGIEAIAKNCKEIEKLTLRGCDSITNTSCLRDLRHLTHLRLRSCGGIVDFSALNCRTLSVVDLCCTKITDSCFEGLPQLINLKELYIQGCEHISDAGIMLLTEKCPSLTKFYIGSVGGLSRHPAISDVSIQAIAANLPKLKVLEINSCGGVTDVRQFERLSNLTTLSLEETKITNLSFLEKLNDLTELSLRGCNKLNDEAIKYIRPLSKLKSLNLSNTGITNKSLENNLPESLHKLDLWGTEINDTGVQTLEKLPMLTSLNLGGSEGVTIKSANYLKRLRNIEISIR